MLGQIQNIREKTKAPLYRVCLTGGPCAGKTSALKVLQQKLLKEGFVVYMVPETPTLTAEGGGMIQMGQLNEQQILGFQGHRPISPQGQPDPLPNARRGLLPANRPHER